jgi:hypothetical protein
LACIEGGAVYLYGTMHHENGGKIIFAVDEPRKKFGMH